MAENQGELHNSGGDPTGFDQWLEPPAGDTATDTPPSNGASPPDTGQGQETPAQGQGNELFKPSDFGAYESWEDVKTAYEGEKPEDEVALGENIDPKEMAKSYANLRAKMTTDAQKYADLDKRFAQLEQRLQAPTPEAQQPEGITPEQLQELWLNDPAKAAVETLKANPEIFAEMINKIPGIDRLYRAADKQEASEVVGNLRSNIPDFQSYEKDILGEMQKLGDYAQYVVDIPDGKGLELAYRAVKSEKLLKSIFEKVGQGQIANKLVDKQNGGAVNLGGNGIVPPKPGQKVKIGNLGEFEAEDLGFVDPYQLSRYR